MLPKTHEDLSVAVARLSVSRLAAMQRCPARALTHKCTEHREKCRSRKRPLFFFLSNFCCVLRRDRALFGNCLFFSVCCCCCRAIRNTFVLCKGFSKLFRLPSGMFVLCSSADGRARAVFFAINLKNVSGRRRLCLFVFLPGPGIVVCCGGTVEIHCWRAITAKTETVCTNGTPSTTTAAKKIIQNKIDKNAADEETANGHHTDDDRIDNDQKGDHRNTYGSLSRSARSALCSLQSTRKTKQREKFESCTIETRRNNVRKDTAARTDTSKLEIKRTQCAACMWRVNVPSFSVGR